MKLNHAWQNAQVPNGPVQFGAMGAVQGLANRLYPHASKASRQRLIRALVNRQRGAR